MKSSDPLSLSDLSNSMLWSLMDLVQECYPSHAIFVGGDPSDRLDFCLNTQPQCWLSFSVALLSSYTSDLRWWDLFCQSKYLRVWIWSQVLYTTLKVWLCDMPWTAEPKSQRQLTNLIEIDGMGERQGATTQNLVSPKSCWQIWTPLDNAF